MDLQQSTMQMMRDATQSGTIVYLRGDNVPVTFQTRIEAMHPKKLVLRNSIVPTLIKDFIESRRFYLQCRLLQFEASQVETDGCKLIFPLDEETPASDTRKTERFPFEADENAACEILNPFDQETRLTKSIIDMSANGLSLSTSMESNLFAPGVKLKNMVVRIGDEAEQTVSGEVVYRRKLMGLDGRLRTQVGIKFID